MGKTRETNLSDVIYNKLKKAIANGELNPGEKIIESKIIGEFGASRTPIREAIKRLEAQEFVETIHNRGTYVRKVTVEEVEHIFDVLSVLESYGAYLATLNRAQQEIDVLSELNHSMRELINQGKYFEYQEKNTEFHLLISRLSRNPFLENLIREVNDRIHRYRFIGIRIGGNKEEYLSGHDALVVAIREKDPAKAEKEMKGHIEMIKNLIVSFSRTYRM